jgi:hypothetical protein
VASTQWILEIGFFPAALAVPVWNFQAIRASDSLVTLGNPLRNVGMPVIRFIDRPYVDNGTVTAEMVRRWFDYSTSS